MHAILAFTWILWGTVFGRQVEHPQTYPSFEYEDACSHELKPHRRTIPIEGVDGGFNQLRLTLVISKEGDVESAKTGADKTAELFWPKVKEEVMQWKFAPFEKDGKLVTAEIEEYIDLVPPERLPKTHVEAPALRATSRVSITLTRSGCYGSCPSYEVLISTEEGIVFNGHGYVVANGRHTDKISADHVRELAEEFIDADFYSMDASYRASVTDNPSYGLSISIDGHMKSVDDYVGSWVGMPAVITNLEEEIDEMAMTSRWISGHDGLVSALRAEKFDFKTFQAQVMAKEAAQRGESGTVADFLQAGLPLKPLIAPKMEPGTVAPFEHVGWLNAAGAQPEALQILINAGASKYDQDDKNQALAVAAGAGKLEAIRALIAYGANPNADLSKLTVREGGGFMTLEGPGAGSILIYAASSGNPEAVKEILLFSPKLEQRDNKGQTAMFAAGTYKYRDVDGARAECIRLLAEAGGNVNARDNKGNTPLHETFLSEVEEELLKLGADVNAQNKDGETPIFTSVDDSAISLFIAHGADLSIRNNAGKTVVEAAASRGPARQEALRLAMEKAEKAESQQ